MNDPFRCTSLCRYDCLTFSLGAAMRRREFIKIVAASAAAWPIAAHSQQSKLARIGVLYIGTADAESLKRELQEGLRELGYADGQNIVFEFRSAEGKLDRLPELAAELVRIKVDVIVALYVPPSLAAKQATRDIPIVVIVGDPVETGIVPSLAHPGGNITGVSLMASALGGKSVELFRDMLPSARRVGVLGHSTNPVFAKSMLDQVLLAGRTTGMEIKPVVMVRGPDEAENAFATMVSEQADAVVVQGSLAIKPVTDAAIKHRVPAASTTRAFADIGGLMSFGADGPVAFRHGAKFVQRILQGKQPKDIPIEQPTKFELAINLRTAKAIGLTIPETFLQRADILLE
jgi:putative tryptophan/tyrosine transport system substrate-binding protein